MIQPSKLKVKQHLVEMNKSKKLFARLPDSHWQKSNEEAMKQLVKNLEDFTKDDIAIEDVEFYPDRKVHVYTVCICDFIRYALVVDKDFNVQYHQLQWKNID